MANGEDLNNQLEFIERITKMKPSERTLETARLTYSLVGKVDSLSSKVDTLDTKFDECGITGGNTKKTSAISGGAVAFVVSVIAGVVSYFTNKGQ
jgi:hypothetical protein